MKHCISVKINILSSIVCLGILWSCTSKKGCIDPGSISFDPEAKISNESCAYPDYTLNPILFKKLDKEKSMSDNDIALYKGTIYLMLEEKDNLKAELEKIDRSDLTKSQEEKLQYLELFANQGEFITTSIKIEFELFE